MMRGKEVLTRLGLGLSLALSQANKVSASPKPFSIDPENPNPYHQQVDLPSHLSGDPRLIHSPITPEQLLQQEQKLSLPIPAISLAPQTLKMLQGIEFSDLPFIRATPTKVPKSLTDVEFIASERLNGNDIKAIVGDINVKKAMDSYKQGVIDLSKALKVDANNFQFIIDRHENQVAVVLGVKDNLTDDAENVLAPGAIVLVDQMGKPAFVNPVDKGGKVLIAHGGDKVPGIDLTWDQELVGSGVAGNFFGLSVDVNGKPNYLLAYDAQKGLLWRPINAGLSSVFESQAKIEENLKENEVIQIDNGALHGIMTKSDGKIIKLTTNFESVQILGVDVYKFREDMAILGFYFGQSIEIQILQHDNSIDGLLKLDSRMNTGYDFPDIPGADMEYLNVEYEGGRQIYKTIINQAVFDYYEKRVKPAAAAQKIIKQLITGSFFYELRANTDSFRKNLPQDGVSNDVIRQIGLVDIDSVIQIQYAKLQK